MHDNSSMSVTQGVRMSPGNTTHPAVPHEIITSVIKKLDHSGESFITTSKTSIDTINNYIHNANQNCNTSEKPTMEDDFSDHDSHYSEDLEEIDIEPKSDMTKQLIDFAAIVSTDIQKLFGHKKGDDDSCDIYEDKWMSAKSGRELYYADLMKIAHGEEEMGGKSGIEESTPLLDISRSGHENRDNRNLFSGKCNKKLGVGPLDELFEYGLRQYLSDRKLKHSYTREIKRLKCDFKKFEKVASMQNRKLPTSFWREPGSLPDNSTEAKSGICNSVLQANNPPDFSDLLESWRLDRSEFNGELSSSEISTSPVSV